MELSKTAYVILGMLKLGRRTGYEIKSMVDVSTRFFWAASYGQIYPELARLERLGLVRGEDDRSNGRKRRAYALTAPGEEALHDWLNSDEPLHIELRHEGALKFFFSDALTAEEQLEQLRRIRAEHQQIAEQLSRIRPAAREAAGETGLRFPNLTLEFGIAYQRFVGDWCAQMERELERLPAHRSAHRTANRR
jgi:PadR family transcriptional regulator, regulatory protein AphA